MASDEVLVVVLSFILVGGVFWYMLQRQNALAKARLQRVESVNRLIEKFSTAKEVIEFLDTEQGRKLLADPFPPAGNPRTRVLRFVRFGIVFLFLGPAFLLDAYWLRGETEIRYVYQAKDLQFWGISSLALGVGLLVGAFLTNMIVKRWGLNGANGKTSQ